MERETPRAHGARRRALPGTLIALPASAGLCCRGGLVPPPGGASPLDPPARQASLVGHPPAAHPLAIELLDPGDPNQLAGLLTGIDGVRDPVAAGTSYAFADLDRASRISPRPPPSAASANLLRARIDAPHRAR